MWAADWSSISIGAAFIIGVIAGGVIVLRMLDYLRRERQGDDDK